MRLALLLVVRTGTAIVVATAAVQFWNLAVRGETPSLGPSIALPPTPTAVAAVLPQPKVERREQDRPRRAEPPAASLPSGVVPAPPVPDPSPAAKPPGAASRNPPTPRNRPKGEDKPPAPSPAADPPATESEVPEAPADPEIVPQPQPPPPPPEGDSESAHHPPPDPWPPWLRPPHSGDTGDEGGEHD